MAGSSFRWIVEKWVRPEERITRTLIEASRNRHVTGTAAVQEVRQSVRLEASAVPKRVGPNRAAQ